MPTTVDITNIGSKTSTTIYIKQLTTGGIFYSFTNNSADNITSGGSWVQINKSVDWKVTLTNANANSFYINGPPILTIKFLTNINISNINNFFVISSDYITINGNNKEFKISGVTDYPGLIKNGSASANGKIGTSIYSINMVKDTTNPSTLAQYGGWICQQYFGKGITSTPWGHQFTINGCNNSNDINNTNCGGILGDSAFKSSTNILITISNCNNTGIFTNSTDSGGILGSNAFISSSNSSSSKYMSISNCTNTGNFNGGGGIVGSNFAYNSSGVKTITYCYNKGNNSSTTGGDITGNDCGFNSNTGVSNNTVNITNCYSTGTGGGGFFGKNISSFTGPLSMTINNCYSVHTDFTSYGLSNISLTKTNFYFGGGTWSLPVAIQNLLFIINSKNIWGYDNSSGSIDKTKPFVLLELNTTYPEVSLIQQVNVNGQLVSNNGSITVTNNYTTVPVLYVDESIITKTTTVNNDYNVINTNATYGNLSQTYTVNVKVNVQLSSVNTLSSVIVENDNFNYINSNIIYINLPSTTISVQRTDLYSTTQYSLDNINYTNFTDSFTLSNLNIGNNKVYIKVTSESGVPATNEFTIYVNSSNVDSIISVNNTEIINSSTIDSTTASISVIHDYTSTVEYSMDGLTYEIGTDTNLTNSSFTPPLNIGTNTVYIKVTAENGIIETKEITIFVNSNVYYMIKVNDIEITNTSIVNSTTPSISVIHNSTSTVEYSMDDLTYTNLTTSSFTPTLYTGTNKVYLKVTENGNISKKEITIYVNSSDTSLSTFTVNGDSVTNGDTKIITTTSINVVAVKNNSSASKTTTNITTLENGNAEITFTVTAENGTIENYKVTIVFNIGVTGVNLVCFKEGSRILTDQGYRLIEELRPGDLVKTELNDYKPIVMIGKKEIYHHADENRIKDQLYQCSPQQYPELTEDLIITGCHCILVKDLTDEQRTKSIEVNGEIYITGNKYRLPACVDERTFVYDKKGKHTIYHIALENENYYKNYGIYANGLLVETCSKRYLKELSDMELHE